LSVEVILVLRHSFDDPDLAARELHDDWRPRHALPVLLLEPEVRNAREDRAPAAAGQVLDLALLLHLVGIDEAKVLGFADELPGEVLGLAVEEGPVVLAHVRAEESVRSIRRREAANPPERRHVRPDRIALRRIAIAPAERRGSVE